MREYLSTTRDIQAKGNYPEALKRYVWYHEHALEHDRSVYATRLSFALYYWKSLADIYPPALKAFKEMRDQKTKMLVDNDGSRELSTDRELFDDVTALNKHLGDTSKNVALFKFLFISQRKLADQCWIAIKEDLFATSEFAILRNYIHDPLEEFYVIKRNYLDDIKYLRITKDTELLQSVSDDFVKNCMLLMKFSVTYFDKNTAITIQRKALEIVDDPALHTAI